jgi:uncharacterized membrane protein
MKNLFHKLVSAFRANIIVGLFLAIPLVATVLIIKFLFTLITDYLVPEQWLQSQYAIAYRLAALLIAFIGLYFIGLFTRNIIGKKLYSLGDRILTKIPFIKTIYISIRQVSESLVSSNSTMFKRVAAIEYPRKNCYTLAFTASVLPDNFFEKVQEKYKEEIVTVFVPTSPNPTSGFILMVPRSSVIPVNISVSEAMKMIMSAGTVLPGTQEQSSHTLLDTLQKWLSPENK